MTSLISNKPLDASDITDLEIAKNEIRQLRAYAKEFEAKFPDELIKEKAPPTVTSTYINLLRTQLFEKCDQYKQQRLAEADAIDIQREDSGEVMKSPRGGLFGAG